MRAASKGKRMCVHILCVCRCTFAACAYGCLCIGVCEHVYLSLSTFRVSMCDSVYKVLLHSLLSFFSLSCVCVRVLLSKSQIVRKFVDLVAAGNAMIH